MHLETRANGKVLTQEVRDFVDPEESIIDSDNSSEIASFYANRSVFITGASGFVGKCLLEKLLRSCPDIRRVFILIRPKRGLDVSERIDALLRSELFDRLRSLPLGELQLEKIKAVRGDITKKLFGVSEEDIELMSSQVSVMIHSAATVKFVEPLKTAVENNVVSVGNLVDLASRIDKLESLVHVSTAYSNCDRPEVDEIFYETPIEASRLLDMSEWMDAETMDKLSPCLLGKRPNTYTFTKAVAESLLVERSRKLLPGIPIAMIRPSIVGGTWRQPIRGWVDNFNGPTGVICAMMTGAIQGMQAQKDYCADIIPVDVVANLIICAAWRVHKRNQDPPKSLVKLGVSNKRSDESVTGTGNDSIDVFNCVSGTLNPVTWRDLQQSIMPMGCQYPCDNLMRHPGTKLVSNYYVFLVYNFFNHTSVAYLGDLFLRLVRKKPMLVIIYHRLMKMITTLKPFTNNQWAFKCKNVTRMYEDMKPIDQEIFNFDIRQLVWRDYFRRYYMGTKIFTMKDDPHKLPVARRKLRRMQYTVRTLQFILLVVFYYIIMSGTILEKKAIDSLSAMIA